MESKNSARKVVFVVGGLLILLVGHQVRNGRLFAAAGQNNFTQLVSDECPVLYSNPFGVVVGRSRSEIPDATVEKVVLYSKKDQEGKQKIERPGIFVIYPEAKATILICHGFMCDKFDAGFLRQIFPTKEYNILTFDFRAHGPCSAKEYCTLGKEEAYDTITAAHFLKEHPAVQGKPLIVYGFSMGAVASIEAQSKDPLFDAMVLDCPFNSSQRVIEHNLDNIKFSLFGFEFGLPGKSFLKKYALHPYVQSLVKTIIRAVSKLEPQDVNTNVSPFKPKKSVRNITVPTYFIHCKNDQLVPVSALKEVFDGAQGYKKLWITNGRRHFDSYFYNPEKYIKNVRTFINQAIDGTLDAGQNGQITEDGKDFFAQDCIITKD